MVQWTKRLAAVRGPVALASNPRPSTAKMRSSKVDEQPKGGPTKIRGCIVPRKSS